MNTIDLTKAGERVRAWRRFLSLSHETLAAAIGMHRETLSRKETGGAEFEAKELALVARVMNISDSDLLGLTPGEEAEAKRQAIKANRESA